MLEAVGPARPQGRRARDRSEELLRRGQDGRGLTRPELAVVLSMSKLSLQDAAEELQLADDPIVEAAAVRRLPEADAQGACRRDPRPPAAQRDHRDQGRQPARQPARPERRVRPDRGGRRVAPAGHRRLPGRRAAARPRQAVGARSRTRRCPRRSASSCSRSLRASVRAHIVGHPPRRRRRNERRARCASCSSPACARSRRQRPS